MKYSIRYYKGCRMLDKADEISIVYTERDPQLLKFIKKHKNARVVADCTTLDTETILDSIDIFKLAGANSEFAIKLVYSQREVLDKLKEESIKFFFEEHINTFDKLIGFINLGVSDVYITDELGFNIVKASKIAHEKGVLIRVFPNVAQVSSENGVPGDTFKFFYIRPEGVEFYESYVDYMEFFGPLDRQSVLLKIYKEGQWLGPLNSLIIGLDTEILNTSIVPYFDKARVECRKRCLENGSCVVCQTIQDLGEILEEKDLGIMSKRKRMEDEN